MQFQQDWPTDKKYSFLNFLQENLEKCRSTELYDAPLEGSTIFLYRSSIGHTYMESCRLAELKYAIFSSTGRKSKKLHKKVMAFDNSGTKAVACDHPQKSVNYHFSSPQLDKPYVVGKLSI